MRYHELELDGPFTSTILTGVEDDMWHSNIIRLPIHTALKVMHRMTEQHADIPNGYTGPTPTGHTARNSGPGPDAIPDETKER